jgi:hypothetical protein
MDNYECGVALIGPSSSSNEVENFSISFSQSFTTQPLVLVTPLQGTNYPPGISDCFAVTVTSVSTTGFNVNVYRVDNIISLTTTNPPPSAGWGQNLQLSWLAFLQD